MSVIYKARQLLLNKTVAIKMLHSHLLNEHSIMRFQQEAKAASSLNHPNVISVHDFGISKLGQPYMVMDFIDGKTLAEVIKSRGALPLPEAMDIFIAVAAALEHAHQNNVLHRDLKPSNIMLRETEDGYDVFLVDFGIAKIIDTENGGIAQQLTQSGDVMGSPLYMSPEQCMGKKLDQRSDIYSFGCILYEAVAGVPPHRGDTMLQTIFKHLNEKAEPLHVVRPDIVFPEAFEDLVESLLATQAEDRIQSISEVKKSLEDIQAGALQRTLPVKTSAPTKLKLDKTKILVTVGVILVIAGLFSLIFSETRLQLAQKMMDAADRKGANELKRVQSTKNPVTTPTTNETARNEPTYENLRNLGKETRSLDLSNLRITDGAILALTNLPNLQTLDLSDTPITDQAIDPIVKMTSLTSLDLRKTRLSSNAIAKLSKLVKLRALNLDYTNTDDNALLAISSLKNLSELKLRDTKISDEGLSSLQSLKALTALSISGCNIDNTGLNSISGLKLSSLDLWDTKVTTGGIKALRGCKSLTQLRLSRIDLSANDFSALSELDHLRSIQLYHIHSLKDDDIKHFVNLKSLVRFYVEDCPIGDVSAIYFAQMPQLTGLALNKTRITDLALQRISGLKNLRDLWIESTQVDDTGMKYISRVRGLSLLKICSTPVTDVGLEYLSGMPNLVNIDASYCYDITRQGIRNYYKAHPSGILTMHYIH